MHLYEGVSIDIKGNLKFHWNTDNEQTDIIKLCPNTDVVNEFNMDGYRYIYGYKYTDKATGSEKRVFRDYLKHNPYDKNVQHFIESGVFNLHHVESIENFDVVVGVESNTSRLINEIECHIFDYIDKYVSFHLIKELYENITFNVDKVRQILITKHKSPSYIEQAITFTQQKFNTLKQSGELFEIKRYLPSEVRCGFENFLKFKTDADKHLFQQLQNANVLIVADFLTSEATVKEIMRYLTSINPNNKLTVFVLVNQMRD